jgi:hypothetical protein
MGAMLRRCTLALFFVAIAQGGWPDLSVAQSSRTTEQKERAAPRPVKEAAAPDNKVPTAASPTGTPPAPEPQAAPGQVGEFQPVLHAQRAKISTCMDTIVGESAAVIDSAHTAISSWSTAAPDSNIFVSVVGLSYANKTAPNAAAVVAAAPIGSGKCQGTTVQVYPIAQSCSALQASLIKEGHTIATLQALPVIETKTGSRDVLIPTAGGGCVLLAVSLRQ